MTIKLYLSYIVASTVEKHLSKTNIKIHSKRLYIKNYMIRQLFFMPNC